MFTASDIHNLLHAQPFVPFRLYLSDGGAIDIRHREVVSVGRRYAVIGLVDQSAADTLFDRFTVVWYMHVTRVELQAAGAAPFRTAWGTNRVSLGRTGLTEHVENARR